MKFSRALLIAVISSLSFVGCKKDDGQEVPSPTPPAASGPKLVF